MKQMKKSVAGTNFSASGVGKLNELSDYTLDLGAVKIPGKVFGGTIVGATGSEFSFQSFAPGTETGFLHTHKTHEELYFFLSGCGEFQVDGQVFPVSEGSVVRVAPAGRRSVRNNGTEPLVMLCIQYRAASRIEKEPPASSRVALFVFIGYRNRANSDPLSWHTDCLRSTRAPHRPECR